MNCKNTLTKSLLFALALLMVSGCAMLPYEEEFSCNKGVGKGTCSRVSENYEMAAKIGRGGNKTTRSAGTYANSLTNVDDAYDKVVVMEKAGDKQ